MPLVISKPGGVNDVRSEEVLGERLGHSNFDGENWAVGDRIIFEDGTESTIEEEPDEVFHAWRAPTLADFDEVKRVVGVPEASNWAFLFKKFEDQSKRRGCASSATLLLVVACAVVARIAR